jgi:hypothetical protein
MNQQVVSLVHACCHLASDSSRTHALLLLLPLLLLLLLQVSPGDVVALFEHFHGCTRKAFREVLEELLTAAGLEAASSMGRF